MGGLFRSEPKLFSPDPLKLSNGIILEHEYMNSDATVEREMKCFLFFVIFSLLLFLFASVFVLLLSAYSLFFSALLLPFTFSHM